MSKKYAPALKPVLSKVALTDEQGAPRTDVRFSVCHIFRRLDGQVVADTSIVLERKTPAGWVFDTDHSFVAPALKYNPSSRYVGDMNRITVETLMGLHERVTGHKPIGRFITLEAPK